MNLEHQKATSTNCKSIQDLLVNTLYKKHFDINRIGPHSPYNIVKDSNEFNIDSNFTQPSSKETFECKPEKEEDFSETVLGPSKKYGLSAGFKEKFYFENRNMCMDRIANGKSKLSYRITPNDFRVIAAIKSIHKELDLDPSREMVITTAQIHYKCKKLFYKDFHIGERSVTNIVNKLQKKGILEFKVFSNDARAAFFKKSAYKDYGKFISIKEAKLRSIIKSNSKFMEKRALKKKKEKLRHSSAQLKRKRNGWTMQQTISYVISLIAKRSSEEGHRFRIYKDGFHWALLTQSYLMEMTGLTGYGVRKLMSQLEKQKIICISKSSVINNSLLYRVLSPMGPKSGNYTILYTRSLSSKGEENKSKLTKILRGKDFFSNQDGVKKKTHTPNFKKCSKNLEEDPKKMIKVRVNLPNDDIFMKSNFDAIRPFIKNLELTPSEIRFIFNSTKLDIPFLGRVDFIKYMHKKEVVERKPIRNKFACFISYNTSYQKWQEKKNNEKNEQQVKSNIQILDEGIFWIVNVVSDRNVEDLCEPSIAYFQKTIEAAVQLKNENRLTDIHKNSICKFPDNKYTNQIKILL